jgi:hypothetical protein
MPVIQGEIRIEGLKDRSRDTSSLRTLLESGARLLPDPKRNDFYEIEDQSTVYYIHISPVTGTILLLAVWPQPAETSQDQAA